MEARRGNQRSGREMIHGKRMILKGGMKIGHGRMTCIARLGKDAEICKFKPSDQICIGLEFRLGGNPALPGMYEDGCEQGKADYYEYEENVGFTHDFQFLIDLFVPVLDTFPYSSFLRTERLISPNLRIFSPR